MFAIHGHRLAAACLFVGTIVTSVHGDVILHKVALYGEPAPGGGTFASGAGTIFGPPLINNRNEVAFWGRGSWGYAIWCGLPGDLTRVVQTDDMAPDTIPGTVFLHLWSDDGVPLLLNEQGEVAFWSCLTGPGVDETTQAGIYAGRPGDLRQVVRAGDLAPGLNGLRFRFGYSGDCWSRPPFVFNDHGQLALGLRLSNPDGTPADLRGIWTGFGPPLEQVILNGDPAPGIPGATMDMASGISEWTVSLSNGGEVGFVAHYVPGPAIGTWMGMPGALALVAQEGMQAPGVEPGIEISHLGIYDRVMANHTGRVVIQADLAGGPAYDRGVWAGYPGELQLVARAGWSAPAPEGCVYRFFEPPCLNRNGQVAFNVLLGGGPAGMEGICAGYCGRLRMLAWEGMAPPGLPEGVVIENLGPFMTMNRRGQVAFKAWLDGPGVTGENGDTLWVGNPDGSLVLVARTGDPVELAPGDVRILRLIELPLTAGGEDGRSRAFNDHGRLVFGAALDRLGASDANAILLAEIPLSSPATGDQNGDGAVDSADFTAFTAAWTAVDAVPALPPSADFLDAVESFDFDADGDIDLLDYCELSRRAGVTVNPALSATRAASWRPLWTNRSP